MPRYKQNQYNWQQIFYSINRNVGTAFITHDDPTSQASVVAAKHLATSYLVSQMWNTNELYTNQLNPLKMGPYLSRWEKILGILPSPADTLVQRRAAVAAKFKLWSQNPTIQGIKDRLQEIIPEIFVDVITRTPSDYYAKYPGGLAIPGGVTLPDGDFYGKVNSVLIRIWRPRDHNGNYLMTPQDFNNQRLKYATFLNNFLPVYVYWSPLQYFYSPAGSISMTAGSTTVTGIGTSFTQYLSPGATFETVDDNNVLQTFTVDTVSNNTTLTVTIPPFEDNTNGSYRILGMYLDVPKNLDNSVFNP